MCGNGVEVVEESAVGVVGRRVKMEKWRKCKVVGKGVQMCAACCRQARVCVWWAGRQAPCGAVVERQGKGSRQRRQERQ